MKRREEWITAAEVRKKKVRRRAVAPPPYLLISQTYTNRNSAPLPQLQCHFCLNINYGVEPQRQCGSQAMMLGRNAGLAIKLEGVSTLEWFLCF